MFKCHLLVLLVCILQNVSRILGDKIVYFKTYRNATAIGFDLESPIITDFGIWGEPEYCPDGHVVTGFQLKMEQRSSVDDTALNGIRFYCGKPSKDFKNPIVITSEVGTFGEWEHIINCQGSYAVGFELRSQKYQGTQLDDSAALNMKLYCSDGNIFEGAGETKNYRNSRYTGAQMCGPGRAICAIQTQVEAYQFFGDDTSLNNVRVKCCHADFKKY